MHLRAECGKGGGTVAESLWGLTVKNSQSGSGVDIFPEGWRKPTFTVTGQVRDDSRQRPALTPVWRNWQTPGTSTMPSVYEGAKVYGPYFRKDGRQHVCLVWRDGRRRTVSYPKYLVETACGSALDVGDTVDHINRDFTDNSLGNLQVLSRPEHAALDAKRLVVEPTTCAMCSAVFTPTRHQLRHADGRGKHRAGPFCSRLCVDAYQRSLTLGAKREWGTETEQSYTTAKEHR